MNGVRYLKRSALLLDFLFGLCGRNKNGAIFQTTTLESVLDVGQGISVGPGKFDKKINVGP